MRCITLYLRFTFVTGVIYHFYRKGFVKDSFVVSFNIFVRPQKVRQNKRGYVKGR